MPTGSSLVAPPRMRPPHRAHANTSTLNVCGINSGHDHFRAAGGRDSSTRTLLPGSRLGAGRADAGPPWLLPSACGHGEPGSSGSSPTSTGDIAFGPRDRPETGRSHPVRSPSSQPRVEGPRTVQLGPLPLLHEPRTHGTEKRPRLAGVSA